MAEYNFVPLVQHEAGCILHSSETDSGNAYAEIKTNLDLMAKETQASCTMDTTNVPISVTSGIL